MVSNNREVSFLIEQLRKQRPESIKAWLLGTGSLIPVVKQYEGFIKAVLKMNANARRMLEQLNYELVVKNVCEIYPELREVFSRAEVRAKVEREIAEIKKILL